MTRSNEAPVPADVLDPGMRTVLADVAAWEPPKDADPIAGARAFARTFSRWSRPALPVEGIEDVEFAGPRGRLRVRIYRPSRTMASLALFLHGGGWSAGSIELADRTCRRLSVASDRVVVSLEYALAPEEPYPAALDDSFAALSWLTDYAGSIGADGTGIVVVGESAGANLAAALCLRERDAGGGRIGAQVLICPVLDDRIETESHRRWGGGDYLVSSSALAAGWRTYLGQRSTDALAAPLRAAELYGLPPATIVVAGCDPLRDDGVAYARKLAEAGTPVQLIEAEGLLHAFTYMDGVSTAAADFVDRIARLVA